jgi:phage tail-like protein
MFPRTVFNRRAGVHSGRVAPSDAAAPDGDVAFCLGADAPGQLAQLTVGDYYEVHQVVDLSTGAPTYIRQHVRFRPPAEMPAGVFWRFTIRRGSPSTAHVTVDLEGAASRAFSSADLAVPLITGATSREHVVYRIELAGTAGDYEVELPGVYVDGVALDTQAERPTLIQRIPGPDETNVPVSGLPLRLGISDPNAATVFGGNIRLATSGAGTFPTRVYVSDVLAYDGDLGFQTGFDGPLSAVVNAQRLVSFTIDMTEPLASQSVVTVRVDTSGGWSTAISSHSYSFTTEDLTAPLLTVAQGVDRRVVRVTASEALLSEDAAGANDALNPALWSLSVASTSLDDGLPAFAPTIVGVTKFADNVFDLATDSELTGNALYTISVGAVHDGAGNQFVEPNNTVQFYGYRCAGPDGRDFDLLSMLPDLNVNEDFTRDLERFVKCYQEVVDQLLCDIDHWTDTLDPDLAAERFLDAMLADLGNPFAFVLSETDKRRLLRILVAIYKAKGTDPGIVDAVRFFVGVEVTIRVPAFDDGWLLGVGELGGDSYLGTSDLATRLSFWLVSDIVLTQEQRDRILGIARYMKRAETHVLGIEEPTAPPAEPDHWEIGLSELGTETVLH